MPRLSRNAFDVRPRMTTLGVYGHRCSNSDQSRGSRLSGSLCEGGPRVMTDDYYRDRLPRDNCRQNAWRMAAMYPELVYVEGYLVFTEPDGTERRMEHAWNEAPGGRIVDSTAWAFAGREPSRYQPDHLAWPRLAASMQRTVDSTDSTRTGWMLEE